MNGENHLDGGTSDEVKDASEKMPRIATAPSWLRDDCLALYETELLKVAVRNTNQTPTTRVRDRVGLLRLGIDRAAKVQQRFPNALFLEFGVHEGKDLVRMATFLRSVEAKKKRFGKGKGDDINSSSSSSSSSTSSSSSSSISSPGTTFHGFDSFEGLPEDWINGQIGTDQQPFHKKGAFATGGESPDVEEVRSGLVLGNHGQTTTTTSTANIQTNTNAVASSSSPSLPIRFHKGWFHETLPLFLEETKNEPVAFVHADADLYSSTLTFLELLCKQKRFRRGSVIVFDEYWNYPHWENGEIKAWLEITEAFGLEWEYFGYHAPSQTAKKHKDYGYQSVGVVITEDMGD